MWYGTNRPNTGLKSYTHLCVLSLRCHTAAYYELQWTTPTLFLAQQRSIPSLAAPLTQMLGSKPCDSAPPPPNTASLTIVLHFHNSIDDIEDLAVDLEYID
jgi:hypothetical protein